MGYFKIIAVFPFLISTSASAFTLWGVNGEIGAGWETKTLSIDMDPNCSTSTSVMRALNDAINVWNNVPTADLVLSIGNTNHALPGVFTDYVNNNATYTGNPLVYCDTSFDADMSLTPTPGQGTGIPGADMQPTLSCDPGSAYCKMTGSIVLLNYDPGDNTNIDSIAKSVPAIPSLVMAHELGHAIGFGHSADTNALMYYDASARKALHLAQDDVDAISYLYPRSEFGGDKVFGCGTIVDVSKKGGRGGGGGSADAATEFALLLLACFGMTIAFSRRSTHNV